MVVITVKCQIPLCIPREGQKGVKGENARRAKKGGEYMMSTVYYVIYVPLLPRHRVTTTDFTLTYKFDTHQIMGLPDYEPFVHQEDFPLVILNV